MEQNNITHKQERFNLPSVKEQESIFACTTKLLPPPLSMTEMALEYVKSGLSVIPIGSDKQPTIHWKAFQSARPQTSELLSWWQLPRWAMAIVCGQGSGDLEAIDFDEKNNIDATPLFKEWKMLVDSERPGLVEKLVGQKSRNKGNHCLYRCSSIEGNKKLAQRAATAEELKEEPKEKTKILIETRGRGGYLLCYPSPGYAVCNGDLKEIPTITPEEREILLSCARALNQLIEERDIVKEKNSKSHGKRPGDKFNREGDPKTLLEKHGWVYVCVTEKGEQWRRPGKTEGISATYFPDTKVFYNFSSNSSMLDVGKGYTPFSLYTMLEADGDFSKAAKQLVDQGYGEDEPTEVNLTKVESFLADRYVFRRNQITQKNEFCRHDEPSFKELRDVDLNSLHMELLRSKLEIGFDAFNRLLMSDFVEEYDPIELYFEQLEEWDGVTDHVKQLAASLKLKDPSYTKRWEECLQRWLIGYVAGVLDARAVNQTAIILVGPQGIGKSRWLNRLVPEELSKYRFVGTINPDNKDTQVYLSECMLINLDELETLKKAEIGALKTTMTQPSVKVRRPYGRLTEDLPRRASFVGSINQTEFLNDATGSRRFLAFEVESVDLASFPDIDKVLAQAYALFKQGERWWFDISEIVDINERNKQFAISTYEEELLLRKTTSKPKPDREMWWTATEIAEHIKRLDETFQVNDRIVRNIGVALTKHQYRYKKSNGSKKYALGWV